jgi:uncharacterized cupin superfamily protein
MRHYRPGDETENLVQNGTITDLGAKIIEGGDPKTYVRVDWGSEEGPYCAGLWRCEPGIFEVAYPFTEHAMLVEGDVTISDANGQVLDLKPGDSFMAVKGEMVTWEVRKSCVKSFLALVGGTDQIE